MKLLYLSCHESLAYDEACLLASIGVDVTVIGQRPAFERPSVSFPMVDREDSIIPAEEIKKASEELLDHGRLRQNFVNKFDAVYFVSRNDWIIENWQKVKNKIVIFRLIGQSDDGTEIRLKPFVDQGMIVLGYSPHENLRFRLFPVEHTIRFYKNAREWTDWNGRDASVMTACRFIDRDGECCNPTAYRHVSRDLPHVLYGPGNENFMNGQARMLDYDALKRKYRDHRVYFYVGTQPASYTLNFIEAWMTGIPVVALGRRYNTAEVCELIENGVNGFFSDHVEEIRIFITKLLENPLYARQIGDAGRAKAMKVFGMEAILPEWKAFILRLRERHACPL